MRILTLGLMVTLAASARRRVQHGRRPDDHLAGAGGKRGQCGRSGHRHLYGAVAYNYSIGKYDVTLGQYTQFLNAVAKTDTYGLYNSYMSTVLTYTQSASSRLAVRAAISYSVTGSNPQAANCPAFDVTWCDAARFSNWLQNGQATATTVGQAFARRKPGPTRSTATLPSGTETPKLPMRSATYFIPSENEWYKAAYYNPASGTNSAFHLRDAEQHRAVELAGSRAQRRQLLHRRLHRFDELPDAGGLLLHLAQPLRDV